MDRVNGRARGRLTGRWRIPVAALLVGGAAVAWSPAAVAAQARQVRQVSQVSHAVRDSANDASGDLTTILSTSGHGGYVSAGIGLRNQGHGTIAISGIPAGATVKSATLLWNVLDHSASAADGSGRFNGQAITGTEVGGGPSPCWDAGDGNHSFAADVTALVAGNASYALSGFASGDTDGSDPFTGADDAPLLDGASLIVIYSDAAMPWSTFQIDTGGAETGPDSGPADATLDGFTVGSNSTVTTTFIVADGQVAGNAAAVNGDPLGAVSFPGAAPQAAPAFSQGSLWDNVTTDITGEFKPGATAAELSVIGGKTGADCVVWVGQVLDVAGATVLGLGDSVAAGYGLGRSSGHGDNPGAYPRLLARQLGGTAEDEAIEGACADRAQAFCTDRKDVGQQLDLVPAAFKPTVVTLTVGADDIDFSACIRTLLASDRLAVDDPANPCTADGKADRNLPRSLAAFKTGLASDLNAIERKYPGVPIKIMDYYNPFAPPVAVGARPCTMSEGLVVGRTYKQGNLNSWLPVVEMVLFHHPKFIAEATADQRKLYGDASGILAQLNGTINSVAAGFAGVTVINPTSFTGHDVCSPGQEWIFPPTLAMAFSQVKEVGGKNKTHTDDFGFKLGGGNACPHPLAEDTAATRLDLVETKGSGRSKKTYAALNFKLTVNCFPHPTALGQQQLADAFYRQGDFSS